MRKEMTTEGEVQSQKDVGKRALGCGTLSDRVIQGVRASGAGALECGSVPASDSPAPTGE